MLIMSSRYFWGFCTISQLIKANKAKLWLGIISNSFIVSKVVVNKRCFIHVKYQALSVLTNVCSNFQVMASYI